MYSNDSHQCSWPFSFSKCWHIWVECVQNHHIPYNKHLLFLLAKTLGLKGFLPFGGLVAFARKIILGEHIIKVCIAELTFKFFYIKITFSQPILSRIVNHAYIKSKENKKHTRNRFLILGSSSLLVFTAKDLLFYSLQSPSLSSEWAPSWFQ